MDETRGLLDLIIARIPGLSPAERINLCEKFEKEEEISILSKKDIEKIIGRPEGMYAKPSSGRLFWSMDQIRFLAEKDEKAARLRGMGWVSWASAAYPPLLREIFDPPALLFYRGAFPVPDNPLAAVVGTRRPSAGALAQAYDIGKSLGALGISVVSGLALGIDAMAHRGNLEGGGRTAAVLGSGCDEIYPVSNRALARRIIENGGVLLSEYPPGTGPRKWQFPARNRIIAGLCRGVLVVEAPAPSGALITARFALEQNRDLWVASSGAAAAPRFGAGTAKLAAEGARVIHTAEDILEDWNLERRRRPEGRGGIKTEKERTGAAEGCCLAASLADSLDIEL
ncbi:MAG: DNA-processing protein DprA [Treponema sp.]|jgi:DNA processing protein|nr:DNA-processing protein DprA [Treponema sp.]